jgi:hypothetical protein
MPLLQAPPRLLLLLRSQLPRPEGGKGLMLQMLRNDSAERLIQELVDGLDVLERRTDATSWDKAALYVERFDQLADEPEFQGKHGQKLSREINKRLDADAIRRGKTIPRPSFRSDALKLAGVWRGIFRVDPKDLPYDHYRRIAVCSLPREQKDAIRADAEHDQPNQEEMRKMIRIAVDTHNGIYKPDFPLKVSNFWKFDSPHDNGGYGGIHPEVVANLLFWFTEPGDTVIDPMAGSGVLADTLGKYRFFREQYEAEGSGPRIGLMSDLVPTREDIRQADATISLPFEKASAKLAILDPPYLRIADNKRYENLGQDADQWLTSIRQILINTLPCITPGGAIAVITDDVLRKSEHVPVAYRISSLFADLGLRPRATVYNHTPNFLFSMGPAMMKAAREARLLVNGCKVIQVVIVPTVHGEIST